MKSILFVIDHLDTGGAPVVVRDLVRGLVDLGAKVSLVVLSDRVTHPLPDNAVLARLPFMAEGRWDRWRRYARHAQQLDQWVHAEAPQGFDLVVAHLHHAHQVVSRTRLADQAWYCLHSDPVIGFLGNKQGLGRRLKKRKVRRLYEGRRIIGVSRGILDRLADFFSVKASAAVALHNPLNIAVIQEMSRARVEDVPAEYLVFVGRLDQRAKRFDRLLCGYRNSGVSLPLVIVGEGDARERLEAMVHDMSLEEKVWLIGKRSNPYAYMRKAKALLLSSDYEGFSLVIAEALACGTPVVSTDCPTGPGEILTGELSDFLVPLGDTSAYADAIRRVVANPPVIREELAQKFSLDRVAREYLSLANQE